MKVRFYVDVPPGWRPDPRTPLMAMTNVIKKKEGSTRLQFDVVLPDKVINQVDGDALVDPEEAMEWTPGDATPT